MPACSVLRNGKHRLEFSNTVNILRHKHISSAHASVCDPLLLNELEADFDWLCSLLSTVHVTNKISPCSCNAIVSVGECLSCKIMTTVLCDQGVDTKYVSLKDIVPVEEDEGASKTLNQDYYDCLTISGNWTMSENYTVIIARP
jgi:aspartate kinase